MDLLPYIAVLAVQGLIIGALARLALPGRDPLGLLATMGVGLAGAFIAGLLYYLISDGRAVGGGFFAAFVFALRAVPGVEEVRGTVYRRAELEVEVRPAAVTLIAGDAGLARRVLDLDADPGAVDGVLAADPALAPLVAASPGRRVPGTVDPFELAVRAILGQQVTVVSARKLAARLVEACGTAPRFPRPEELLAAPDDAFPMPAARREALRTLARAAAADPGWLEPGALLALPGIGPWTAGYIAMRALGDRDAFLPTDAGVRAGLRALGIDARRSDRWRPYRAHAMLHLWDAAHTAPRGGVARP